VMEALKALTDRANRSGTVIYTVDTRGLETLTLDASYNLPVAELSLHNAGPTEIVRRLNSETESMHMNAERSMQGLSLVASLTGGLAYENGNDMNYGLARVLEDQKGYYLLGFHPEDAIFAVHRGEPRFNHIKVKVLRPGLEVRSRTGFYGETDEQAGPKYRTHLDDLRALLLSPFRSSAIRVQATPIYSSRTKKGALVRNLLHIDVNNLTFEPQLDGSSKASIDLLAVAVGMGGVPLAAMARNFAVVVQKDKMDWARRNGVVYALDLAVPKPGPYQFRMAVQDRKSGKSGSASRYLDLPDLKHSRLALTSVVLNDDASGDATQRPLGLTAARRQFQQGGVLQYFCLLETGAKAGNTLKGELEAHIRILHDDKVVYSGSAPLGKLEDGSPAVTGKLKLTEAISPGEYFLQVVAYSRNGKREDVAAQWTDFEVVN